MEPHSPAKVGTSKAETLEGQLREIYGRVAYTHKTHEKMADCYTTKHKTIKAIEIVVSALLLSSLILAVFGDSRPATITGAVLSTISLVITLYFKEADLGELVQKHTVTASKLWGVREQLLSLLVDYRGGRSEQEVRAARDEVNRQLESIYKSAPRTSPKAYGRAQDALKNNEELYFSDAELDHMLPKQLRKTS